MTRLVAGGDRRRQVLHRDRNDDAERSRLRASRDEDTSEEWEEMVTHEWEPILDHVWHPYLNDDDHPNEE